MSCPRILLSKAMFFLFSSPEGRPEATSLHRLQFGHHRVFAAHGHQVERDQCDEVQEKPSLPESTRALKKGKQTCRNSEIVTNPELSWI